jgi:hypothetical protein
MKIYSLSSSLCWLCTNYVFLLYHNPSRQFENPLSLHLSNTTSGCAFRPTDPPHIKDVYIVRSNIPLAVRFLHGHRPVTA